MRDRDVDIYLQQLHREARANALRKLAKVCGTTFPENEHRKLDDMEFNEFEFECWGKTAKIKTVWPLGTSGEEMYASMVVQLRLEGFPVGDNA